MNQVRIITIILACMAAAFTGCSLVDEDLSDCESDHQLTYELSLVTNISTEIQAKLDLAADVPVKNKLQAHLKGVFSDHAHDVDLSFYDVAGDFSRLHHESHIMDANQSSYTLYIPVRQYIHLCCANVLDNGTVKLEGDATCHEASLAQEVRDTVESHKTGLFTARKDMDIKDGIDENFSVNLYMANCSAALVIDTLGCGLKDIKAYATGFATGFSICDSTYVFKHTPIVRPVKLCPESGNEIAFVTVNFPSRDDGTKAPSSSLWQFKIYSTLQSGTVVETVLGFSQALEAGNIRVIKTKAQPNGSVQPGVPEVGVSVDNDWSYNDQGEIVL